MLCVAEGLRAMFAVVPMLQQDRRNARVALQDSHQLLTAIASKTGNSNALLLHRLELVNYSGP